MLHDKQYVIFSSPLRPENVMNALLDNGVTFKVLLGMYNSTLETSYIVSKQDFEDSVPEFLIQDEESILVLSEYNPAINARRADIINTETNEIMCHGVFVDKDPELRPQYTAWTYDPLSNKLFVIEHVTPA